MTQKETKRQHYVPRTYLKNFSAQRKSEFYIKALPIIECVEKKIFETNISKICIQNDFYTLPGETEKERQLIETFYSEHLESKYQSVYEILTNPEKRTLTEDERYLIISTVVTMYYRTTKLVNTHNDFMDRVLRSAFDMCSTTGKESFKFEEQEISIKGKTLEDLQNEFRKDAKVSRIMTQLEVAMKLIRLRTKRDSIYVLKLEEPNAEFITSDHPVCYFNLEHGRQSKPFDPANNMSLPLDSKHILYLMPYGDDETKTFIARNVASGFMCRTQMLTSNFDQFREADRFLLGQNIGLKTYCAMKEISEKDAKTLTKEDRDFFKNFIEEGTLP